MPKLIALWTKPADPAGFDADYEQTHVRLVNELPGVTAEFHKVVQGDHHRVAILSFDSMDAFGAAIGGTGGAALLEDAGRLQETFGVQVTTVVTE